MEFFDGQYEIIEQLGEGGFGVVYKARQATTGQLVAIKVLRWAVDGATHRADQARRFRREIELSARLHHPHIVRLMDSGETVDGHLFAVFAFVPGQDLAQVLAVEGRLALAETQYLMAQVLDALSCAHDAGIVHRDLKPSNIMLTHTGVRRSATILDFGVGAFVRAGLDRADAVDLTPAQGQVGTPAYAAPEQLRGQPTTGTADLYAWGLIFIECLTGERVISAGTPAEAIFQQLDATPVHIPPALEGHALGDLLRVVTSKDVNERAKMTSKRAWELLAACDLSTIEGFGPPEPPTPSGRRFPRMATADTLDSTEIERLRDDTQLDRDAPSPTRQLIEKTGERRPITALHIALELGVADPDAGDQVHDLLDLDEEAEILSEYQEICQRIIQRSRGHLMRTPDSSMVAFYGYPSAKADDALRAVRAGLDIVSAVRGRAPRARRVPGVEMRVRVAAYTGLALVRGRGGSLQAGDFFGDPPRFAAQLCAAARDNTFLIDETTHRQVRDAFTFSPPGLRPGAPLPGRGQVFGVENARRPHEPSFSMGAPGIEPAGPHSDLAGRTEEMAVLRRAWNMASESEGQVVLLVGERGMGKSRLLRAFLATVGGRPHHLMECRCLPADRNSALRPIVDLFEHKLGYHQAQLTEEDKRKRLAAFVERYGFQADEMVPFLAPHFSSDANSVAHAVTAPPVAGKDLRQRTLAALLGLFTEIAAERPLLLAIEDLQWADPSTIELLTMLVESVPTESICVVMTSLPDTRSAWQRSHITQVRLGRLSGEETHALIQSVTGGRSLPAALYAQIVERADGVPLYIEELTHSIVDSDLVEVRDEGYVLTRALGDGGLVGEIPGTLRGLLMARLDALEPEAKDTVQLAAVLGREFSFAELHAVSALSETRLETILGRLVDAKVVYRRQRIHSALYSFRHALLRETAYDSLPRRVRREVHGLIARTLEERFPALLRRRPDVLAHHCAEAGDFQRATEHTVAAGQRAVERGNLVEAARFAEQGLTWLARLEDGPGRAELELSLNEMLGSSMMADFRFSSNEYGQVLERSRQLGARSEDDEHTLLALWGSFGHHFARAEHRTCEAVATRYVSVAERAGDEEHVLAALSLLGLSAYHQARFTDARAILERARALFDPRTDPDQPRRFPYDNAVLIDGYLALTCWTLGQARRGRAHASASRARAEASGDALTRILALFMSAQLDQLSGERELTGERASLMRAVAEGGFQRWVNVADALSSWAARDPARGEQALAEFERSGHLLRRTYWNLLIAQVHTETGDDARARALLDDALERAERHAEHVYTPHILMATGRVLAGRAQLEEADAYLARAAAQAHERDALMFELQAACARARLRLDTGRAREAPALLEPVLELVEQRDAAAASGEPDEDESTLLLARTLLARAG